MRHEVREQDRGQNEGGKTRGKTEGKMRGETGKAEHSKIILGFRVPTTCGKKKFD